MDVLLFLLCSVAGVVGHLWASGELFLRMLKFSETS